MALNKVAEEVFDLVISYIHNVDDRNSFSLVSRKFLEIDGITRKRLIVNTLYYPNPASLSIRFPFVESLTLQGPPSGFNEVYHYHIKVTPWILQIAREFRCLKELDIRCLVVNDEDLKTLARTRGKDLRSLKIKKCKGFRRDGLMHVSMYCNHLRTLCLEYPNYLIVKDGTWLHQLALNNKVLERLHVKNIDISDNAEELTLLAKNCCNSLISLKIGECYLSKLGDAFRYALRLEQFGGIIWDEKSELKNFWLPPNMCSLSIGDLPYSVLLPNVNHIRKLKLVDSSLVNVCDCLLLKKCPNLEVLYTKDECGDRGLQVIGQFCKKLRKLTHNGLVTHVGMIALVKGCTNLESLEVRLGDISNEAIECVGTYLKNLCKVRLNLVNKNLTTDLLLDNGVRAMLMGCNKLERLDISNLWHWHGGLTDVGLEYIGKYGVNLRSLSVTLRGNSNAGLVNLSKGCPNLRKLKLSFCLFSEQALSSFVFNMPSLKYVWFDSSDRHRVVWLTRPGYQF